MQQGGGIGHDFSTLRPKGALVKSIGADASGPVSFMDVWDAMCRTIMSAGRAPRRHDGARCAATIPTSRPSSTPRRDPARLRKFNLSVLVTDAFMRAVQNDADWPLVFAGKVYRTVRARALWDRIMRATYDYAEPGVDLHRPHQRREQSRLLRDDPGHQPLRRAATAALWRLPAGLDQSGAPGRPAVHAEARSTTARLEALTATAVRFLDNVIDVSNYPAARADGRRRRPSAASASASPASPMR